MVSATSSGAAKLKAEHRRQIRVVCVEQAPEPGGAQKIEWLDLTALSKALTTKDSQFWRT